MRVVSLLGVLVIVGVGCSSSEDEDESSRRRCTQLRDHLVDVRLKDATNVDIASHRVVMQRSLGERFVTTCAKDMSDTQLRCALAAGDSASVAACSLSN